MAIVEAQNLVKKFGDFDAKSGRSRTVIPGHAAHRFRSMSHSESGVSRTL